MDAQRWDTVTSIFDQAMSLPPDDRDAFITRACGGDEALRAEVTSLVAAHHQAPDWLEGLADAVIAPARRAIELGAPTLPLSFDPWAA